jgi:hypothetical protein
MSTPVTTSLNPWGKPVSQANVVRSHPRGRVCAHEGCTTILSIYNPSKYCAAHPKQALSRAQGSDHADATRVGKRPYSSETKVVRAVAVVAVSEETDHKRRAR